jgi:hypothetical protein
MAQKNPQVVGGWHQEDLLSGAPSFVNLPKNLPNGNYLIRHEVITLQRAKTWGLAEFYPNCLQIKVTGGSEGEFYGSPGVRFPGAYKANDPGILVDVRFYSFAHFDQRLTQPQVYSPGLPRYVVPGGKVATVGGGGNSPNNPNPPAPVTSERAAATTTSEKAAATQAPINVGAQPPSGTPSPDIAPVCVRKRSAKQRRGLLEGMRKNKRRTL